MENAQGAGVVERADDFPNRVRAKAQFLNLQWKSTANLPLFAAAIFILIAVQAGLFLYYGYFSRILRPYSDLFDLIDFYFRFEETGNWIQYLLEPHNYHRLIWFRLLLAFDIGVFKGSGLPFLAVAVACQAVIAWLLVREIRWAPAPGLRLPAIAVTLMYMLSTGVVVDLSVPANTPYVHTLFFAVLALVLAEPLPGEARQTFGWRRTLALLCVCAAAFSNAVGLVLWAVLAFKAWRGGRDERPWLGVVVLCAAAFSAAYLYGQPTGAADTSLTLASLFKSVEYFFTFMGLPWARASGTAGRLLGVFLFACALVALVRCGGRDAPRFERVALGMILFSLGAAALAALGRRDIAAEVIVPGRYTLLVTPLKLGLLMLALPWLERQWTARRRLIEVSAVTVLSALIFKQVAIGQAVAEAGGDLRATITAFHQGKRTPEMTLLIHPDLERAEALCKQMFERGLYSHRFLDSSGCRPAA